MAISTHPEYWSTPVPEFLEASMDRFAADGLPTSEVRKAIRDIDDWPSWWGYWMDRSRWFESIADERGQSRPTRAELLVLSMLAAHLAQYLHFDNPDEKEIALRRKIDTYRRLLPLLDPPARTVDIPFHGGTLPGIFWTPSRSSSESVGCVIYVGGLDAHKEDGHVFVEKCVARGIAVLALDLPGQGEALLRGNLFDENAYQGISAAIDVISELDGIDRDRIGVIGRSLGGYLGPRVAAEDPRVRAVAVWGAMYDLPPLENLASHTRKALQHVTGAHDTQQTIARLGFFDLAGIAERVSCPTLVVHGGLDALAPPRHARRLAEDIGANCDLRIFAGSPHCNHDLAHIVRPLMADWLARELR